MTQTIEQLTARVRELEEENARLNSSPTIEACRQMIRDKAVVEASTLHEQLAAEQLNNKLLREALEAVIKVHGYESGIPVEAISTQVSTEALDQLRAVDQLEIKRLRDTANECRLDLLIQVHELADHIERANYCISDPDMQKQINGQREYAISVASKWNQNGNPFLANQPDTSALDAYVAAKVKEAGKFDMWKTNPYTKVLETSIKQLTKQRDLAVEALHYGVKQVPELATVPGIATAIKESEAK